MLLSPGIVIDVVVVAAVAVVARVPCLCGVCVCGREYDVLHRNILCLFAGSLGFFARSLHSIQRQQQQQQRSQHQHSIFAKCKTDLRSHSV